MVSDQAEGVVSLITGVHLDPENGKIIALQCGFKQVLSPVDILKWKRMIHVRDSESLTTREHLLRLQSLSKDMTNPLYKLVCTENGEVLGRVYNFIVDTKLMELFSLIVRRKFLWFTMHELSIPHKNIVEILEDKIIVKDVHATEGVREIEVEVA